MRRRGTGTAAQAARQHCGRGMPRRRALLRRGGLLVLLLVPCAVALLALAAVPRPPDPRAAPGPPTATPTRPGGADNPYPTLAALEADSAAALAPPGAVELARGGRESARTLGGVQPPDVGRVFGTQGDADAVYAYYDRALRALGYVPVPGTVPASADLAAWRWCGPQVILRLAIKNPDTAYEPSLYRGVTYRTVVNPVLIGKEPAARCDARDE